LKHCNMNLRWPRRWKGGNWRAGGVNDLAFQNGISMKPWWGPDRRRWWVEIENTEASRDINHAFENG
jgi:hypothetical protein